MKLSLQDIISPVFTPDMAEIRAVLLKYGKWNTSDINIRLNFNLEEMSKKINPNFKEQITSTMEKMVLNLNEFLEVDFHFRSSSVKSGFGYWFQDHEPVARAFLPIGSGVSLPITTSFLNSVEPGGYGALTIFHEAAHQLGLGHGHDGLSRELDMLAMTVTTYRASENLNGWRAEPDSFPQTFMPVDLLALQTLYGADYATRAGNTTYSFNFQSGSVLADGEDIHGISGGKMFFTLWDGGGVDTFDLKNAPGSGEGEGVRVDLRPGKYSILSETHRPDLDYREEIYDPAGNIYNPFLLHGNARSLIENVITGDRDDTVIGNMAPNFVQSGEGADTLLGLDGDDHLRSGAGADHVFGGEGRDVIATGLGNDRAYGGVGNDVIYGQGGADVLHGGSGSDGIYGGGGDDVVHGFAGNDLLFGGAGDDRITGSAGTDEIHGGDGADYIVGGAHGDSLYGGTGDDTLFGMSFDDRIEGGFGNDFLDGGQGGDLLLGGGGNDRLYGREGNDVLNGGSGHDALFAGNGSNIIKGGSGHDLIDGQDALIFARGGDGDDLIFSGSLGGTIYGDRGDDKLFGGIGKDTFIFSANTGTDRVRFFDPEMDTLLFHAFDGAAEQLTALQVGSHSVLALGSSKVFVLDAEVAELLDHIDWA